MKNRLGFLSALLFVAPCFGAQAARVSEEKALEIVRALPEFAGLKQRLGNDVGIDGPDLFTPAPLYQVGLGSKAWRTPGRGQAVGRGVSRSFLRKTGSGARSHAATLRPTS